jgi:hypothetical protein
MDNNTKLLVGGIAAAVAGFALYKYMTKKAAGSTEESNFTADEGKFMNYVDEGFMGMHGSTDDLLMVGGCKPVEFANASSHNPPLATDEPNFANSNGFDYLGGPKFSKNLGSNPSTPPITPKGSKWAKPRKERPMKGVMDFETGEYTKYNEPRSKYAKTK